MTLSKVSESNNYLVLQMSPVWEMSADSFFDFCQLNSHLRIERNAQKNLSLCPQQAQKQEIVTLN